jgi:hypothetical protein
VEIATAEEKAAWQAADAAYKKSLQPITDALKALAKPFEQQIVEERKRKLDPRLLEALNIPKDKRTGEQKRLGADADSQVKPSWDEIVEVMPAEVKAERAKLRERLHEPGDRPRSCPRPRFRRHGEAAPQSRPASGDPHGDGPGGSGCAFCDGRATKFR